MMYDESMQKYEKQDGHDESKINNIENKHIYYDCLEQIFVGLFLANTCKWLQIAATAKFSDKYDDKAVHIMSFFFILAWSKPLKMLNMLE